MLKRVLSAVVLLVLTAVCFVVSTETALLLIAVCGCLCCHELSNALKKLNHNPVTVLNYIFVVGAVVGVYFSQPMIIAIVTCAVFIADFVICMKSSNHTAQDALATLGMMVYPSLPVIMISYVCSLSSPEWIVVFVTGFLSAVLCDTFALFGGMAFGKHKLAPTVSPNKTIEGSVTGSLVATAFAVGAWFLFRNHMEVNVYFYALTVLLATVAGQIGDLSASFIKREAGVKDFGNLIPGHGGMLDRIDSMMFSIPVVYILLELFKMF